MTSGPRILIPIPAASLGDLEDYEVGRMRAEHARCRLETFDSGSTS
jgi:hypothetical protein